MNKNKTLIDIYNNFCQETGYNLVFGVEQEFYLGDSKEQEFIPCTHGQRTLLIKALSAFPFFGEMEEEKGLGQFEVQIAPTDDPAFMADMVEMLRKTIKSVDNTAVFSAKPYPGQPGSALHIHVNLIDSEGKNLFSRKDGNESIELNQSIAGLLELMPASIKYFAPYEAAYARYIEHGMESPSAISWGADNRTTALRIPSVPITPHQRRIEHRVPCADADPYLTMAAIIIGMQYGLVNKLENTHKKIWGNAFLPQYNLPKLPHNFASAKNIGHEYLDMVMAKFKEQ